MTEKSMERNRTLNPEFVEWMKNRIKMVGEELIERADVLNLDGIDALTELDISIRIPTIKDEIEWPSITFNFSCGERVFMDNVIKNSMELCPPKQFV